MGRARHSITAEPLRISRDFAKAMAETRTFTFDELADALEWAGAA
jgi:hypothetical protein